jgi:3-phosphoshikimate 1-carboxyvinyltransferase
MSAGPVEVAVPGDKSITHRALLLAALADGESRLDGLLDSADTRATAAALRELGIDAPTGPLGRARIMGKGTSGLVEPTRPLDCANSGTTARLLLGILAGCPFEAVLTGDPSLRSRPMRRVTEPLAASGASFREMDSTDRLPIRVRGRRPLYPIGWRSPRASAQVKSALLLAGVTGRATVQAGEPGASRDHTERMLQAMGARIETRVLGNARLVVLEPPDRLEPLDLRVPGDLSAAAFFLALGALSGAIRARGVGLNPGRTGALAVLERMGARVEVAEEGEAAGEPVGTITVTAPPGRLKGTGVGREEVPALIDEVPVLAALAARAEGETRFDGVAELRVKESDRVDAMSDNLRALGVETETGPDHLVVVGSDAPLVGVVDSRGDHRIAMAFGILGALDANQIEVRGSDAVQVSFPGFWDTLDRARKEIGHR